MTEARMFSFCLIFLLLETFYFAGTASNVQTDLDAWTKNNVGQVPPSQGSNAPACQWTWTTGFLGCLFPDAATAISNMVSQFTFFMSRLTAYLYLAVVIATDVLGNMYTLNLAVAMINVFVSVGFIYSAFHGAI